MPTLLYLFGPADHEDVTFNVTDFLLVGHT
jgi:hypothetical protein